MNAFARSIFVFALLLASPCRATEYDLQRLAEEGGLTLQNREIKTAPQDAPHAVYLTSANGDGIAWVEGSDFSEGEIEVQVRGRDRPGASFVGVAFRGKGETTYEAVYLRPFNFRNPARKNHALQYISMPRHDWSALRNSHPGKYESSLDPAPEPESWVTLRLVVSADSLAVHINDSDTPELEVDLIGEQRLGKVGLWVGNGSDGEFRRLVVRNR